MRDVIADLPASRIREVANAGLGRPDVLAFWFGEGDEVTPEAVREAAIRSLRDGETFYSHNQGLPPLREAIAGYAQRLHPAARIEARRVVVTSSGVNGLMIANQALVDAGDEVVAVVPVWPNLVAQPIIMGARVREVALRPDAHGRWHLDLAELLQAIGTRTRLLILNAPNNPTGWTLTREEQVAVLDHCRSTGTWILADEVYERLYYGGEALPGCAPSFLDIARPDDRLVVVHSFSKSFLMTGWRLGWLIVPDDLAEAVGKLVEFNTSCAPVFVQRAGLAALADADAIVAHVVRHLRTCRDLLVGQLAAMPGVEVALPDGGMYAWFRLRDAAQARDSVALARRLVEQAGLGVAPGAAFGQAGEGWLRWCFASRELARLEEGVARLKRWMG